LIEDRTLYRTHRLICRGATWRTRGDAFRRLDPPISPESVIGRVVAVQRDGTWHALPCFPRTLIPIATSLLCVYGHAIVSWLGRRMSLPWGP
jgi:hypothetical protein